MKLRGIAKHNRNKTCCKNGHEFTKKNTKLSGPKKQWRNCRICLNAWSRKNYHLKRKVTRAMLRDIYRRLAALERACGMGRKVKL